METDFIEDVPVAFDDGDDDEFQSSVSQKSSSKKHEKLIDSIVGVSGKKKKVKLRTEPITNPNEIAASTQISATSKKIKSHQLLSSLKKKSSEQVQTLKKQLAKVNKHQATLEKPLEKTKAEKAERIAAYQQETKTLSKWDPIVEKNRTAETMNFPLDNGGVQFQTTQEFVNKLKPLSSLEKDIAAILQSSTNNIKPDSLLTPAEKQIISKMDLLEAKQRLAELKKMRALVSYQQAKFRRVRKIKSKKFRRLARKDRQKQEEKELEKMAKENPDQFLERLEQLERRRVEERSTLRHKNSTKWAKEKRLLAKFDTKVREEIEEQLKLGEKLSSKQKALESDSDDDNDEQVNMEGCETVKKNEGSKVSKEIPLILAPSHVENESNPWLSTSVVLPSSEYSKPQAIENNDETSSSSDDDAEQEVIETPIVQEPRVEKKIETIQMPTIVSEKKSSQDEAQTKDLMNIQEAFADDDVVAEFEREKADIVERDRPKPIDLSLPGWGEWAGSGVPVNKRKKRKFMIPAKPAPPRRDVHLHHVIISETANRKISEHRVSDLPFPFAKAEQFESLVQQPLGREWNPETAYRRLIQPKVRTRIGVRIDPISKQDTFVQANQIQKGPLSLETMPSNEDTLFDNEQKIKRRKFKKTT